MQKVTSFKTEDGVLHENKIGALKHEYFLAMRGFFQRQLSANPNSLTTSQVANIAKEGMEELYQITSKHRQSIIRSLPRKPKQKAKK